MLNDDLRREVNEPNHYERNGYSVMDIINAFSLSFTAGNVVKYICRYKYKHDTKEKQLQDLEKARRNLDILIENFNESIELGENETPHFNFKAWFPDEDKTTLEKIEEKENQINDEAFDRLLSELYDGIQEDGFRPFGILGNLFLHDLLDDLWE